MPPDLSAAERAYSRLKSDILEGKLSAGPLDIGGLGDRLRMSATPVREALARLSAERLVQRSPHHGYVITHPSARRLQHLYELNGALLDLSLQLMRHSESDAQCAAPAFLASDYASSLTRLLRTIAASQPNLELTARIAETGDRLFAARRCEPTVFSGAAESLVVMSALWDQRDFKAVRSLLCAHHEARIARAHALAQALADKVGGDAP